MLHPRASVKVWLLLEHEALDSEGLDPLQQVNESLLVNPHVVGNEIMPLSNPGINRSQATIRRRFDLLSLTGRLEIMGLLK